MTVNFPGPLDYTASANLMNDPTFRGRIKVSCLHFAVYISGEPLNTPAHNTRFRWAQDCFGNPDGKAMQVQPSVVMDDNVQAQGDAIDDSGLQTAVETAIQNFL
jgi:hypothetical protein